MIRKHRRRLNFGLTDFQLFTYARVLLRYLRNKITINQCFFIELSQQLTNHSIPTLVAIHTHLLRIYKNPKDIVVKLLKRKDKQKDKYIYFCQQTQVYPVQNEDRFNKKIFGNQQISQCIRPTHDYQMEIERSCYITSIQYFWKQMNADEKQYLYQLLTGPIPTENCFYNDILIGDIVQEDQEQWKEILSQSCNQPIY